MKAKQKKTFLFIGFLLILLGFINTYPKMLVGLLGEDNPWTSYLYMYGFGLVTFVIGMFLIVKQGSLKFTRGNERTWFHLLLGGFLFFSTLHGLWILLAIYYPYKGVQ